MRLTISGFLLTVPSNPYQTEITIMMMMVAEHVDFVFKIQL